MSDTTPNAEQSWDVAVIGGGAVGLSSALELQQQGRKVVLIDPDLPRARASFGNAGVISRFSIFAVASPAIWGRALPYLLNRNSALRIRYSAWPYFARWLAHFISCCSESHWRRSAAALNPFAGAAYDHHVRLAKCADATALVKQDGYLELFRYERTFESGALEREMLTEAGIRYSVVNRGEIRELEPSLGDVFCKGLFIHDSGRVDSPGRLVELYQEAFRARGGTLIPAHARAIEPGSSSVTVHLRTGDSVRGARAVVAAGVWSAELIAQLGYRVRFTAERGYHLHFELRPGAALKRPMFDIEMNYGAAQMGETIRLLPRHRARAARRSTGSHAVQTGDGAGAQRPADRRPSEGQRVGRLTPILGRWLADHRPFTPSSTALLRFRSRAHRAFDGPPDWSNHRRARGRRDATCTHRALRDRAIRLRNKCRP